ncbi:MAG: DUF2156 domain-containing protein [Clostridia bacterium]|nr:DUF2156 domain-containing protein [Clostridia bacterium]
MTEFKPITYENIREVEAYFHKDKSGFCDFTPFVLLMWQKMFKTEYAKGDSVLYLRYRMNGKNYYALLCERVEDALAPLKELEPVLNLTLVCDNGLRLLEGIEKNITAETDEGWWDYVYSHESLATLKGKKYAGQRNHINKFEALCPDWKYERINADNIGYVAEFFDKIYEPTGDETHDFEGEMVKEYLNNFSSLPMLGGFVTAGGKITSFAIGEILSDTLFVHVEKADREIHGSYPIIVREFARDNPANLVNREEDMGIEGLRTSKLSYHPERLLKKYNVEIR